MPLYEYECRACGHRFERIQKYSDPIVRKCPRCKKSKVQKQMSAPAVQFKGTGWYVTDYPNADRKKAMEAEKKASGNGGAAAPSSTESKESKTPAKD